MSHGIKITMFLEEKDIQDTNTYPEIREFVDALAEFVNKHPKISMMAIDTELTHRHEPPIDKIDD